jgi:ubiquinone/menaquinone biosynthesis C-methylase UbiE
METTGRAAATGSDRVSELLRYFEHAGLRLGRSREQAMITGELIGSFYDDHSSHFSRRHEQLGFMNYGYWYRDTTSPDDASTNLMDKLVEHLPQRSGRILDVACGNGATTSYLAQRWKSASVFGLNISPAQIGRCRDTAPDCHFSVMDAATLSFNSESFSNVICVEGAFHFNTREMFLREAFRILTSGGRLVLTDMLLHADGHKLLPMWLECNFLASLADYQRLVHRVGFSQVQLLDITREGWRSFVRFTLAALHDDWLTGVLSFVSLQDSLRSLYRIEAACKSNFICIAIK